MGITCKLKQISISILENIKEDSLLLNLLFEAKWLPESELWLKLVTYRQDPNRSKNHDDLKTLELQLLSEWEAPELDLHKYFPELTYLLAGYVPSYFSSEWIVPELMSIAQKNSNDFLPFLVVEKSEWDGLPLVNAIGAGTEINFEMGYGKPRYLLIDEVGEILDGLLFLSEEGFQERYRRESEKANPLPWIDWDEEEMLDWMTDYFNDIQDYYTDTFRQKKAMLLYLT
jgi:hypothetical protein